jgi:hypothetical protein
MPAGLAHAAFLGEHAGPVASFGPTAIIPLRRVRRSPRWRMSAHSSYALDQCQHTAAGAARPPLADRRSNYSSRDGCTEAILLAHGVTIKLLIGLIKAGRATVRSERMLAGGRPTAVTRVRITDAGRRELSGRAKP